MKSMGHAPGTRANVRVGTGLTGNNQIRSSGKLSPVVPRQRLPALPHSLWKGRCVTKVYRRVNAVIEVAFNAEGTAFARNASATAGKMLVLTRLSLKGTTWLSFGQEDGSCLS